MRTMKQKLADVDADHKANQKRARAFNEGQDRRVNVGIAIELRVLIPGKGTKAVIITRSEETAVCVDPTDCDTMVTVLRGSLYNAGLTLPMNMLHRDDNVIYEIDTACPECDKAREKRIKAKKSGKRGRR